MKVTRDFGPSPLGRGTEYRWYVEFEGQQYAVTETIPDDGYRATMPPIEYLERDAQRRIMRAIQHKLFGDRTL
jgi:hypothetical protein